MSGKHLLWLLFKRSFLDLIFHIKIRKYNVMKKVKISGLALFKMPQEINTEAGNVNTHQTEELLNYDQWLSDYKNGKVHVFLSDHEGIVYQAICYFERNELLASIAPNLMLAYFDLALEYIQFTDKYKGTLYYTSAKQSDRFRIVNETIFNRYIQYRSSGILFLHLTVEAFINYIIPDNFIYEKKETSNNDKFIDIVTRFNKEQIERWISFKEKIDYVLPKMGNGTPDLKGHPKIRENLLQLAKIRDEIVHLKSATTENNRQFYQGVFKILVQEDLKRFVDTVKGFLELYRPGILEFYEAKDNRRSARINVNKFDNLHMGLLFEIQRTKFELIEVLIKRDGNPDLLLEKLNLVVAHLGMMEEMKIIDDYHLEEKEGLFLLTVYKTPEQIE